MANDGDVKEADIAQPSANGEPRQPVETQCIEIAPRRSAVRARLAPWRKGPQNAGLSFSTQTTISVEDLPWSRFGQAVSESAPVAWRKERALARQAGGHWFEPSSAHRKALHKGFCVAQAGDAGQVVARSDARVGADHAAVDDLVQGRRRYPEGTKSWKA